MNTLIITDTYGTSKEIPISDCAHVIPRIGEQVAWRYTPYPRVVDVTYDYVGGLVYVEVR